MPRTARASAGGYCYHVLNRGNARAEVFHKSGDYQAFLALIAEAGLRTPMRARLRKSTDERPAWSSGSRSASRACLPPSGRR
jgi:hypothetical protein